MDFNRNKADPVALLTPEKPHFFKVILTNTITEGKLGIPKEFERKYGCNLPNQATLKVLPDTVWKIGLTRSDGVVWLQNGWKEFLDYYSIVHGHFLVFRYKKNSHFSVTIFDPTATEIDYPYTSIHEDEESETEETADSVSVEIVDNMMQGSRRRQKSQLSNPRPHKMVRTNSTAIFNRRRKSQADKCGLGASTVLRSIQSKILRMEPLRPDEKAFCLEMASGYVSDYPHFKVVMQPSFLRTGAKLNIPPYFAREHMKKVDSVILLNYVNKRWHVSYFRGAPAARLQGGWLKFAHNNNLEAGDVCVFELIGRNEPLFRVTTFKFREYDEKGVSRVKLEESLANEADGVPGLLLSKTSTRLQPFGPEVNKIKGSMLLRAKRKIGNLNLLVHEESAGQQCAQERTPGPRELVDKFTSAYPFFKITFRRSHQKNVTAPWTFTKKLTKQTTENDLTLVHLQVGENSWTVKFRSYPEHKHGKFGYGWSVFARENSLEIDDVCIFELINKDDAIVKVSIKKIG